MTDEEYIPSINKLFNSLGRKMTKRYYGLDVTFEVISITPISFDDVYLVNADYNYGELKSLRVKVTPPIPQILDVKTETDFVYGKYADGENLEDNLEPLLGYVGLKGSAVTLTEDSVQQVSSNLYSSSVVIDTSNPHIRYNNQQILIPDKNFITLSNGTVVEKKTGLIYVIFVSDSHIDFQGHNAESLANLTDYQWWESLTNQDIQIINKEFST
jgi:hypothetical protein